ncbi:DUF724 domain-containing protein 7-like [Bidens hawaiensis]|uniref:DUF724 domain-containing protein 7-like n=1 Tax=Bidens hawaiensis TaxID=980011 RepID=UPI004048F1F2
MADGKWAQPEKRAALLFPLDNNKKTAKLTFLVEYICSGINDEPEVQRVSIDHPHIHPSVPQIRVTSFGLLEKVYAFYDFSWWSGVITQKLADSRYTVYFKHTNTVKEFSHEELKSHVELKDDNWVPTCQPTKRAKSVELKCPVNTSAKKKGKLSAGSKGSKALVKAEGDLALTTTPTAVKKRRLNPELSAPVVLGLRCMAMTVPKNKKSKQLVTANPQTVGEPEPPQSGVLLVSKTTDKQVNQVTKTDGDTSARSKWGRTFIRNANRKTLLTLNDANEEPNVNKSPDRSGLELALQQTGSNKLVKGKRGRRRTISLNMESSRPSHRDLQGSRAREDNGKPENLVEKSLDAELDDQPINNLVQASRVSAGKGRHSEFPPFVTTNKDQNPKFEKRSAVWKSIETTEAFRLFPQNPHFGPLNSLSESARERTAIHKMVNFSTVFEDVCRLRQNDPKTKIEEKLEILLELETHGFDVGLLTSRLKEMLSLKDEAETHRTGVKEPKDNIGSERAKIQKCNRDITVIDRQIDELIAKREQLMKENEKSELKIEAWEEIVDVHERAIGECDRKIDDLATAPF